MMAPTGGERLTALEVELHQMRAEIKDLNAKIDLLLSLKDRGMGAMWLAGIVVASGIIGWFVMLFHWVVGDK